MPFEAILPWSRKMNQVADHMVVGLTPLGKSKAEHFTASGPIFDVLSYLQDNGASSIKDIAGELHTTPKKARVIVKEMISSGYVRRMGADEG
jgi:DNA-binding MarR family transcriptional regulator